MSQRIELTTLKERLEARLQKVDTALRLLDESEAFFEHSFLDEKGCLIWVGPEHLYFRGTSTAFRRAAWAIQHGDFALKGHRFSTTCGESACIAHLLPYDPSMSCKRGHSRADHGGTDARGRHTCRLCSQESVRRWRQRGLFR